MTTFFYDLFKSAIMIIYYPALITSAVYTMFLNNPRINLNSPVTYICSYNRHWISFDEKGGNSETETIQSYTPESTLLNSVCVPYL
jgi:hypothetical protein